MDGTTLIETEILGVTERVATRKSDGAQFTMYDVQVSDGAIYTTTFVDIANDAYALLHKTAKLSVKIQQNGQWVNRYLQKVLGEVTLPFNARPEPQAPPPSSGFAGAAASESNGVTSHTAVAPTALAPQTPPPSVEQQQAQIPTIIEAANDFEQRKQEAIHRQTATKVAAMLFVAGDSQVDFWDNVDTLIRFFDTGVKPLAVEMRQEARV